MKKAIVLILLISLLLVSCKESATQGAEINYKQGFIDISLESLGNKQEYQGRSLELPVLLHNQLAYDIENVQVSVAGFDNHYVELYTEQLNLEVVEGRDIFNPEGGKEQLVFSGLIKQLLPGASKEEQNYRVQAKYNSKVEFTPSICVTGQLTGYETYQGGCQFQSEISYSGQGAPLGVTKLQIVPRQSREVELRMTIENKGKGKVGTISLGAAALGGKPLGCDFRGVEQQEVGFFSFNSGQKSVNMVCTGFLSSESPYQTALQVELFYNYELSEKQSLTILE